MAQMADWACLSGGIDVTMPDRSERGSDHERKKRDRQDQAPDSFYIRRFEGHSQTPVYLLGSSIQVSIVLGCWL